MIYENGALKRILIDGGYVEGDVSMVFAETPIAEQGLQPYKYNGKELDQMNGLNLYDYGARYYESALGRFTTMDPMCEKYYNISPYTYCANNLVRLIDPDGRELRLYVETKGLGHVFVRAGTGDNTVVYTYGRYGELGKDKSSARGTTPTKIPIEEIKKKLRPPN